MSAPETPRAVESDTASATPRPSLGQRLCGAAAWTWRVLGSYGLAVVILLLLLVLTFKGTLEQKHDSIYNVQRKYFESMFLTIDVGFPLPMPGAYLLLSVLFANLVVGGMIRIRKAKRLAGVFLIHIGMALLLLGGMVEFHASTKGVISLHEAEHFDDRNKNGRWDRDEPYDDVNGDGKYTAGEVGDRYMSYFDWDLAITQRHDDGTVTEHIVPFERLEKIEPGEPVRFRSQGLGPEVVVRGYASNARVELVRPGAGYGVNGFAIAALAEHVDKKERNTPGMYVALHGKTGKAEALVWARQRWPAIVTVDELSYLVDLRKRTWELPYKVRLNAFIQKQHPGINMPAEYSSRVTKIEDDVPEDRLITMNEPLRHRGHTLYQTGFHQEPLKGGRTRMNSELAVVKNPADRVPLIACVIISLGLLIHFALKLFLFHQRERRRQTA